MRRQNKKPVLIQLRPDQLPALEREAERRHIARNQLVRDLIDHGLQCPLYLQQFAINGNSHSTEGK